MELLGDGTGSKVLRFQHQHVLAVDGGFAAKLDAFGFGFETPLVGTLKNTLTFCLGHGRQNRDHHFVY